MKKALFLVLVVALVIAFAAPAFAAGWDWGEPAPGTPGAWQYSTMQPDGTIAKLSNSLWILPVGIGVNYALKVESSAGNLDFGWTNPGTERVASTTLTVQSNDAFTKSFTFTPDVTGDSLFAKMTMDIDGTGYTSGAVVTVPTLGTDVETLNLRLKPDMTDQGGVLHKGKLVINVTQS
jgi:hypothetical protein